MKTVKEYSETIERDVGGDVEALLAAIKEISESEVRFAAAEGRKRADCNGLD